MLRQACLLAVYVVSLSSMAEWLCAQAATEGPSARRIASSATAERRQIGSPLPGAQQAPPDNLGGSFDSEEVITIRPRSEEQSPFQAAMKHIFVQSQFTASWMPGGDDPDTIGMTDLWVSTSIALPGSTKDWAYVITPGFGYHAWNGPTGGAFDVPESLYDATLDFTWKAKFSPRLSAIVGVTPGLYSDFQQEDDANFRITGRALATYKWKPTLDLIGGVVYVDRLSFGVIPAVGAIWKPTDDVRWEFVMPRPRYARRIGHDCQRSTWVYLSGEFGGGAWGVERQNGNVTEMEYNDFRFLVGIERKGPGRSRQALDFGYIFGREIEFNDMPNSINFDDTIMLRASLIY